MLFRARLIGGEIQESPALWYTAPQGTLIFGQPPMMISRGRSPENGKSRGTPEAMKKRRAAHEFFHLCGLTMAYVLRSFRPHVLFLTSLGITRRTNSAKFFQTRACSHVSRDLTTARLYHQSRGQLQNPFLVSSLHGFRSTNHADVPTWSSDRTPRTTQLSTVLAALNGN